MYIWIHASFIQLYWKLWSCSKLSMEGHFLLSITLSISSWWDGLGHVKFTLCITTHTFLPSFYQKKNNFCRKDYFFIGIVGGIRISYRRRRNPETHLIEIFFLTHVQRGVDPSSQISWLCHLSPELYSQRWTTSLCLHLFKLLLWIYSLKMRPILNTFPHSPTLLLSPTPFSFVVSLFMSSYLANTDRIHGYFQWICWLLSISTQS